MAGVPAGSQRIGFTKRSGRHGCTHTLGLLGLLLPLVLGAQPLPTIEQAVELRTVRLEPDPQGMPVRQLVGTRLATLEELREGLLGDADEDGVLNLFDPNPELAPVLALFPSLTAAQEHFLQENQVKQIYPAEGLLAIARDGGVDPVTLARWEALYGDARCEAKTDYPAGISCGGPPVRVGTVEELAAYAEDFGLRKGKYRDLELAFDPPAGAQVIHSPCEIRIRSGVHVEGTLVCLDARQGVRIEKGASVAGSGEVTLLATGHKGTIEIEKRAAVSGAAITGSATHKLRVKQAATLTTQGALHLEAPHCKVHRRAVVQAGATSGSCFEGGPGHGDDDDEDEDEDDEHEGHEGHEGHHGRGRVHGGGKKKGDHDSGHHPSGHDKGSSGTKGKGR